LPGAVGTSVAGDALPVSRASATVKGLSVEPGSKRSVVRVVRGHVGEGQDLSRAHVERHQRPRLGAVLLDRMLERAVSQALQLAVERKPQVGSVLGRADRLDVLDDAAEAVLDHAPAARLAAEMALESELDPLLACVIDPGKADYVSGHFATGIVAPVFRVLIDAPQP
jgi:hypothetical protein